MFLFKPGVKFISATKRQNHNEKKMILHHENDGPQGAAVILICRQNYVENGSINPLPKIQLDNGWATVYAVQFQYVFIM